MLLFIIVTILVTIIKIISSLFLRVEIKVGQSNNMCIFSKCYLKSSLPFGLYGPVNPVDPCGPVDPSGPVNPIGP